LKTPDYLKEQLRKCLEVSDRIGGVPDLVSPSRKFIKEGKLNLITPGTGTLRERYVFLVSMIEQLQPANI
jgi:hypothetical protein